MHLLSLIEVLSVFLVVFYLYCRSPAFRPLMPDWSRPRGKVGLYLVFSGLGVLGNYLGVPVVEGGAIVNGRAVGATLAGLLGGPLLGFLVGATAGVHRVTALGGMAATAGALATTLEGVLAGIVHLVLKKRGPERLISRRVAFATAFVGEIMHMGIVLLVARPFEQALAVVRVIGPPMVLLNPVGAALFMSVLLDRRREQDRVAAASSARALKVAERALELMARGFRPDAAASIAAIVKEETGVGAVGVTDTERILGWVGLGADHHVPGHPISNPFTRHSVEQNVVVFADGVEQAYDCQVARSCPLHSVLIVPLQVDGKVVGTVQLFEPRSRRFLNMNKRLGEGIGALLSSQLLLARYEEQKNLLVVSELKLLQAQVNPHFLFNALNTIAGLIRGARPDLANTALARLSELLRYVVEASRQDRVPLAWELEFATSYLELQQLRFGARLQFTIDHAAAGRACDVPPLLLQPLIENAVVHGVARTREPATIDVRVALADGTLRVAVANTGGDGAGSGDPPGDARRGDGTTGVGLRNTRQRLERLYGADFTLDAGPAGPDRYCVTIALPQPTVAA
jgi:two-component system, LytTR family, sensor kinase